MNSINPVLFELLHRSAVSKLSDQKREIYQFIERQENRLEEVSLNEREFIQHMRESPPYKAAAEYFSLDIAMINQVMNEAQADIDRMIMERCRCMKWIDCTDMLRNLQQGKSYQWVFLFIS